MPKASSPTALSRPTSPALKIGGLVPWRERPFQRIKVAAELLGVSPTKIYDLEKQGKLTLRKIDGRTVVETAGIIALVEFAEPWTPRRRTQRAA